MDYQHENFSNTHYYEKHLLGRIKTHFLGRVARLLRVLAAKNTYLQGRVAKPPLKIGFLGRATPQPPLKMNFQGWVTLLPLKMHFQGRVTPRPAPEILFPGSGHHLTRP